MRQMVFRAGGPHILLKISVPASYFPIKQHVDTETAQQTKTPRNVQSLIYYVQANALCTWFSISIDSVKEFIQGVWTVKSLLSLQKGDDPVKMEIKEVDKSDPWPVQARNSPCSGAG